MAEHAGKPKVRFAGFTETWEQRKLGDFTDIRTGPFGSTLHAKDYVEDGIPIITTEHFKSGALPVSKVGIPQISKKDYERLASYILEVEDIVFSRVGSVDMNALISEHQAGWVFSGRVLRVRLVKNDSRFLHTLLETENVKNDIKSRAVGQTMPCINTEILKSTEISLSPSRQEQVKIGTFFRQLDRLVTLHQCNCNMATRPCEWSSGLRAIAWEQRKFEKIAIRSSAMAVCSRSLPGVEYEDIISEQGILNKDIKTKRAVKIGIKFLPGDVLFGKLRPYLKNWLLPDFTGVAVGDFWVLQPSEIDSQYLYYLIQTPAFQEVSNQSTGTKMPRADWNLVANSMFFLPQNDDEQTCIGTFFRQLDRLITLHQRKHILLT